MKRILLAIFALGMIFSAQAQRVYINPGHGDWGSESRNMATVTHAVGDTTGFWESNTNLWKGFALNEKLRAAGFATLMSRTENGPYPYVWGDESIDKPLLDLGWEAEYWGATHYISIHSNAGPTGDDGSFANYPLYIYKGYDGEPSNWASEDMAYSSIMRLYEIFDDMNGPEPTTYYSPSNPNVRGSSSFYGYTLGALNHSVNGYLAEGYFHTYSPARHRALNPDWCRQEGVRYFRGIMDYYGYAGESVGYILGYVRSMTEMFSHANYISMPGKYDEFKPINGAKVVLRNAQGQLIKCNCYPYVARMLKNQDYYTTDDNYNGVFMFENLQPGTYTISVHASGYQDYKGTITVYADKTVYPEIFLTPGQGTEPNIGGLEPDINWELNGGMVPGGTVPTNAELWEAFKTYYQTYYNETRGDQEITAVATFMTKGCKIMTDEKSEFKWLGDYIKEVSAAQGYTLSNDPAGDGVEAMWRWSVHSFFNCNKHETYPKTADFTTAGKPEAWGHAYQVATGSSAALPSVVTSTYTLPTPVKEGYDFVGWFDNPNGTGTSITSIPAGWKGTLYAIWTEANVDVKWVLAGGTVAGNLPKEITGAPYTIPTPVKEGYIFLGWYENPNGNGTALTVLPVGYKGVVYAVWREAKVTWELNGGKVMQEVTVIDVPTNEQLWEDFMNYFNVYYPEAGRYPQSMESLTSFWPNDFDPEVKIMLDQASEFAWLGHYIYEVVTKQGKEMGTEALWRWNLWAFFNCTQHTEYPVTADFTEAGKPEKWGPKYQEAHGGGSSSTELVEVQLPSKITATYTIPTPVKDGADFLGWYDTNAVTGTKLTTLPAYYDGTVYAIWNEILGEVTWELNGGKVNVTLPNKIEGSAYTLPTPTKDGYVFVGWYDNANGEGTALESLPVGFKGTVYAIWREAKVTWVLNGGKVVKEVTVPGTNTGGATVEVPTNDSLWNAFKAYYKTFYNEDRADQPITAAATFMTQAQKIMTDASSEYKWLGDYILSVASAQSVTIDSELLWRFSVHTFFNAEKRTAYPSNVPDFSTAGKPEAWGPAYQAAHGGSTGGSSSTELVEVELPSKIEGAPYTIPTPVKEGDTFVGWYNNNNGTGEQLTVLPVGYDGTVYAIWNDMLGGVTWELNGGKVNVTLPNQIEGSAYTLPTPTKDGYVFLGWYDNAEGEGTALESLPVGFKGTVYAIWREAKVTWVLNGGKVVKEVTVPGTNTGGATVEVPTNDSLWNAFKAYYKTFYNEDRADQPITAAATFMTQAQKIMTDASSEYKWLGDYILSVASAQSVTIDSELLWRFSVHTFFNAEKRTAYPSNVPDFSTAGKPEAWGPAYQAAHGGSTGGSTGSTTELVEVELPSKIEGAPYTIPTPVKEGDTFVGWYNNNQGTGEPLTVLPVGYDGTVYAIWKSMLTPTSVENVARPVLDINAPMYDIMGRQVDETYRGIIIQNGNKYLLR